MWPFKTQKNNFVSIALNPQCITCCWLTKINDQIIINAYEKTDFKSLEFENSTPFNPTKISLLINNFIKNNTIKKPIISMAISGPSVIEKIVTVTKSNPEEQDFNLDITKKNITLNYTYLCPAINQNINIGFNFYICGISQANLLQYKLLTLKTAGNLSLITTELAALLELYKYSKNKNFSQSQLAIDLNLNNYDLKSLFSPEIINTIYKTKDNLNFNLKKEYESVATSIGLLLIGDKQCQK